MREHPTAYEPLKLTLDEQGGATLFVVPVVEVSQTGLCRPLSLLLEVGVELVDGGFCRGELDEAG